MSFVHLNLRSEYAVEDSLLKIKEIVDLAKSNGQMGVGISDPMNLYSLVKFYKYAYENNVKPIIGSELTIESDGEIFNVIAFSMTHSGYLNLSKLISKAYLTNQNPEPRVSLDWLLELNEDLLIIELSKRGDIYKLRDDEDALSNRIQLWTKHFPDRFYLELVRTGRDEDEVSNSLYISLAHKFDLPLVATNDVRFSAPEKYEAHEIRCCVNAGELLDQPNRKKTYSKEQFFKSTKQMRELFSDIPGALANTVEICKRCTWDLNLSEYFLPDYPVPKGMSMDDFFIQKSKKGLEERLQFLFGHLPDEEFIKARQPYDDRLKFELNVIIQMGFPGYFFIVADFIQWAKNNDIPVGPGRGSGAGSLVAYSLKITDLDPLQYDLLFERFLNPERVSMPDFDVDFCMERRDEVINYVSEHYGRDHVSQIVTFGTMAAKAAVKDVGRVLGYNYGMMDSITKKIPNEPGIKLKDALKYEEELRKLYCDDEDVQRIVDFALELEGTVRNTGKHAGGVVIAPKPLHNFCPVQCEPDGSSVVTQLDKNDVESIGLVKFDFLGLRTLTIVDWTLKFINQGKQRGNDDYIEIERIPLDDPKVFHMIKTGKTTGVFQLESPGMQSLITRLKPDTFEDLIALVALFRPGPLESGMVDNFIKRKHGSEQISYPDPNYQHDSLKTILDPTYGVILYQEQVMQIAQVLAGYSLGEADLLRRAMGKKKPEEMEKQRSVFRDGAVKNGVDADLAMKIFDLVEKFAGYGFNKSHSAAYALVSYQSAWLKTHYPAEFMAAQISSDMDNTDKVVHMVNEAKQMKIKILPLDINVSENHFMSEGEGCIRYGLGAVKGVGGVALDLILSDRSEKGPYKDLFDFCYRIKIGKRILISLIYAGAFDCFGINRKTLIENLPRAIKQGEQRRKEEVVSQLSMFGDDLYSEASETIVFPEFIPYEKFQNEFSVLGLYLTGHPMVFYRKEVSVFAHCSLGEALPKKYETQWVAGIVVGIRKTFFDGEEKIYLTLEDETGSIEVMLSAGVYDVNKSLAKKGEILLVEGEVYKYSTLRMTAINVMSLSRLREITVDHIEVYCDGDDCSDVAGNVKVFSSNNVTLSKGIPVYIIDKGQPFDLGVFVDPSEALKIYLSNQGIDYKFIYR